VLPTGESDWRRGGLKQRQRGRVRRTCIDNSTSTLQRDIHSVPVEDQFKLGLMLHELRCRWPIHRIQSSPSSSTDNGFDVVTIVCRRKARPIRRRPRSQQLGYND